MFTLAMPQSLPAADRKRSACCSRSVKIDDDRPCADAFCISMASSSESNGIRYRTGAKVSCCTMGQSFSRANDRGRDEVALALEHLLAGDHLAAGGLRLRDGLRVALDRALVDRADP